MAVVRAALTETINAYPDMPAAQGELWRLRDRLEDVRRANVDHHLDLIAAAADRGVQVLCLGELFASPYFALGEDPLWRALAEDAREGPTVRAVGSAAARHGLVVIAPIYELDGRSGRRFNTAVVVDERGEVVGTYRKTHVPHGSNERGSFRERFYYERGDGAQSAGPQGHFPVFATSAGTLGVAICYDRHFEGVVSTLAARGAEIVFCPSVTFGAKAERLWRLEFAVDAARHRVFVGGSNRRGAEAPWHQEYFGQSHFCGPDGAVADRSDHANLVIADLDLDSLRAPDPSGWSLRADARPDLYAR